MAGTMLNGVRVKNWFLSLTPAKQREAQRLCNAEGETDAAAQRAYTRYRKLSDKAETAHAQYRTFLRSNGIIKGGRN